MDAKEEKVLCMEKMADINDKTEKTLHEPEMEIRVGSILTYGLKSRPPLAITLMAALQHILVSFAGALTTASVVADATCVPYDHELRSQLFCTSIFMVGICTITQTAFGIRLPIFQGPSSTFLVPLLSMAKDAEHGCEVIKQRYGAQNASLTLLNNQTASHGNETNNNYEGTVPTEVYYGRLQQISGALILASLVEVILGGFGLLNVLIRFIGPITIGVTIAMVGVTLVDIPLIYGRPSFPITFGAMFLVLIFVLYMGRIPIPFPRCRRKRNQSKYHKFYIFMLLPILLALIIMWVVSAILTSYGVFSDDPTATSYLARTDVKADIITNSPWFSIAYPGQFGPPKFNNPALIIGFTLACISSLMESVGDYYAAQSACEVVRPPSHAISRGIFVEGLGSLLSGFVGAGHATTSYSGNIAILTITKTASRMVMYVAGVILIILSMFGKAGASVTAVPNPVLGGVMMALVGTLVAIGLSSLRSVNLQSSRNIMVVGTPMMAGLLMPRCLQMFPNVLATGSAEGDRIIKTILGTPMFVGGILALILENTVPDPTKQASHPFSFKKQTEAEKGTEVYSWDCYSKVLKPLPFLRFLPFMPGKPCDELDPEIVF